MTKYNIKLNGDKKEAAYCSLVNEERRAALKAEIVNTLKRKKKYKDKNYSAKNLAEDLGTNTRYISAVVNVRFHMNYTSFVNKYRIEEAMGILTDRRYIHMKMEDISQMVGFANRQSFYAAFFKINGCTPREYKLRYAQRSAGADSSRK